MDLNWSYSPETPNLGPIRRFLALCDLELWRMTLKNNRAPLLSNIKLYISFHHHMWIQTGVTVRKWLSWVVTSVTLTFNFWPWPFAWTLLWSVVITPENFMMIRLWEHSQKCVTDRQADRRTDRQTDGQKISFIELLGRSSSMLLQAFRIIPSSYVHSNWRYSQETAKLGYDLCDLDLWPMTLTFLHAHHFCHW